MALITFYNTLFSDTLSFDMTLTFDIPGLIPAVPGITSYPSEADLQREARPQSWRHCHFCGMTLTNSVIQFRYGSDQWVCFKCWNRSRA